MSAVNANTFATVSKLTDVVSALNSNGRAAADAALTVSKIFGKLSLVADFVQAMIDAQDLAAIRTDVDAIRVYNDLILKELQTQSGGMASDFNVQKEIRDSLVKVNSADKVTNDFLKIIADKTIDLSTIEKNTLDTVNNTKTIADKNINLSVLEKNTGDIAINTKAIFDKKIDLSTLEKNTGDIVINTKTINDIATNTKTIADKKIDLSTLEKNTGDIVTNTKIINDIATNTKKIADKKIDLSVLEKNTLDTANNTKLIDTSTKSIDTSAKAIAADTVVINKVLNASYATLRSIDTSTKSIDVSTKSIDSEIKSVSSSTKSIDTELKLQTDNQKKELTELQAINKNTFDIYNTSNDIKKILQDSKSIDLSKVEKNTLDTSTNTKAISDTLTDAFTKPGNVDSGTDPLSSVLKTSENSLLSDVTDKLSLSSSSATDNSKLNGESNLSTFDSLKSLFPSTAACSVYQLPVKTHFSSFNLVLPLCQLAIFKVILEWVIYALTALYVFNASLDVSMTKD